jgi:hypothetical protein
MRLSISSKLSCLFIIRRLFHTSLLFIFGVCLESPSIGIVTEYVPAGDLGQFLSNSDQKMEISLVSKFATEICSGNVE